MLVHQRVYTRWTIIMENMRVKGTQDACIFRNIYPKHIATWTAQPNWYVPNPTGCDANYENPWAGNRIKQLVGFNMFRSALSGIVYRVVAWVYLRWLVFGFSPSFHQQLGSRQGDITTTMLYIGGQAGNLSGWKIRQSSTVGWAQVTTVPLLGNLIFPSIMCLLAGTRCCCFPRRDFALMKTQNSQSLTVLTHFFRPDSPKVMRQTLQLRDCEGGSTLGMESGMEDGDVWGRNRNCQVNQWHTDLGLIGTLGWELMQMDDGSFERPKAGASIVGREMAWQRDMIECFWL